jgi:hypothetical protein
MLLTVYYLHFIYQNLEGRSIYVSPYRQYKDLVLMPTEELQFGLHYMLPTRACTVTLKTPETYYANLYLKTTCPHEGDSTGDARRDWKKLVGHGFAMVGSLVRAAATARIEAPQLQRYMRRLEKFTHCQRCLTSLNQHQT